MLRNQDISSQSYGETKRTMRSKSKALIKLYVIMFLKTSVYCIATWELKSEFASSSTVKRRKSGVSLAHVQLIEKIFIVVKKYFSTILTWRLTFSARMWPNSGQASITSTDPGHGVQLGSSDVSRAFYITNSSFKIACPPTLGYPLNLLQLWCLWRWLKIVNFLKVFNQIPSWKKKKTNIAYVNKHDLGHSSFTH